MEEEQASLSIIDAILFSVILGFASGIVFGALAQALSAVTLGIAVSACLFSGACFFIKTETRKLAAVSMGIFLFASLLGIARFDASKPDTAAFAGFVGKKITVSGTISDEPEWKLTGQQFTLDADSIPAFFPDAPRQGTSHGISISVTAGETPALMYGDEITVTGKLALPENFTTDQGTEFDYVSYLYKDDVLYQISYAKAAVVSRGHGNPLVAHLIPWKNAILESFDRILPAREADLLAGLNLGEKENIDKQFRDDLVTTGTIHIIALSGYNVTIVATFLRAILARISIFGQTGAAAFGALGIIVFVTMTGLQSSAIRAGIMALIALFAQGKGRAYDAFRALMLAGFLMILWDPKYLVYDVSFQLSFLATLGILFITPVLQEKFRRVPETILFILPLRELMAATLGAQIGVLPFILYKMGTLSLIALPANIFVLPAVPYAMGIGAAAGLLGAVSIRLAYPLSLLTYLLLEYIQRTVIFFANVPHAAVVLNHFPLALCVLLYLILFAVLYFAWKRRER